MIAIPARTYDRLRAMSQIHGFTMPDPIITTRCVEFQFSDVEIIISRLSRFARQYPGCAAMIEELKYYRSHNLDH